VILTQGPDLFVSLAELQPRPSHTTNSGTTTLEQVEREHILKALRESNWTIGGLPGLNETRDEADHPSIKMQKLGVTRPS